MKQLAAFLLISVGTTVAAPATRAEEWTNLEGTSTIDAVFLGMWGDSVVLRRTDGRRFVIPKAKLNAQSRLQADSLAAEKEKTRDRRIGELSGNDGDFGSDLSLAPSAPYEAPPAAGAGLDETVSYLGKMLQAGHIRAVWDVLPPSYQNDLNQLSKFYGETVNAHDLEVGNRLANQLARTLYKQKDFVFSYHQLAMAPPELVDMVRDVYDPVVGILLEFSDEKAFGAEALKTRELGDIIAEKDETMGPHIAALLKMIPPDANPLAFLQNVSATAIQNTGNGQATMNVPRPGGGTEAVAFVQVEDRWVPADMASQWADQMKQARQAIAANNGASSNADQVALVVSPILAQIESAETQEEFDRIIDMLLGLVQSLVPNLGPQGMAGNPAAGNNSGFSSGAGAEFNSGGVSSGGANSGGVDSSGGESRPRRGPAGVSSGG